VADKQQQAALELSEGQKVYFASDFHLGIDARLSSRERERQIVDWLEQVRHDAAAIYLVGDLFDFWYEYRTVVPKGYVRFLGKLAELRDAGIDIYCFTGNHDMWMFDYFEEEFGIPTFRQPVLCRIQDHHFFIAHGDGLGPGDYGYKLIKKIFANRLCQWLFARVHPNIGIGLANYWSGRSRSINAEADAFLGADQEWLLQYANRKLDTMDVDYFVFGHRHLPIDYTLKNGASRYINLGDWLKYNSYGVFDGQRMEIRFFRNPGASVYGRRSASSSSTH